jgi:hypothetical protein
MLEVSCGGGLEPQPGEKYRLVLPHVPADRQPDVCYTVRRVEDGYVFWENGSRSPTEAFACINGARWQRIA